MAHCANPHEPNGDEKVTQLTLDIETSNGVIVASKNPNELIHRRQVSPITMTLALSIAFAGAYAAYHRIGTVANADTVEYTPNLFGGFLAVGMTKDQPGFIVLSALDQDKIEVSATQTTNRLARTRTVVDVGTLRGTTRTRLRRPQVILVTKEGTIEKRAVDWTADEFNALRSAADCSYEAATKKRRCGAPFTDLQEAFADWPPERVPDRVLAFLAPFKDHRADREEKCLSFVLVFTNH